MRGHNWILNTRNIRETIDSFARGPLTFHLLILTDMCSFCWQKCVPRLKLFLRWIFNVPGCTHTDFHICALHCYCLTANFCRVKRSVASLTGHWFTFLVVLSFISHLFGDYANNNMWKLHYMKAWNSFKNDCGRSVKNQMQWPLCWKHKISKHEQGIFHNNANDCERWGLLIFCC